MSRFFADKIDTTLTIVGEEHNHMVNVLRSRVGDRVTICNNNDGLDYFGTIVAIEKKQTIIEIFDKKINECEPQVIVDLYMAILKGDKNDLVCQKATELGVSRIIPLKTKFVAAREESFKIDRLSKICENAAKQCGRARIPKIATVTDIKNIGQSLSEGNYDCILMPYENATGATIDSELNISARRVAIIVGSEGGFSEEEVEFLRRQNARVVTLGKRILRAETANIAVLAVVMNRLGEWS